MGQTEIFGLVIVIGLTVAAWILWARRPRLTAARVGLAAMGATIFLTPALSCAQTPSIPIPPPVHTAPHHGGEASLVLPDLNSVSFMGVGGHTLLMFGLLISAAGLVFGGIIYMQLKN